MLVSVSWQPVLFTKEIVSSQDLLQQTEKEESCPGNKPLSAHKLWESESNCHTGEFLKLCSGERSVVCFLSQEQHRKFRQQWRCSCSEIVMLNLGIAISGTSHFLISLFKVSYITLQHMAKGASEEHLVGRDSWLKSSPFLFQESATSPSQFWTQNRHFFPTVFIIY